MVPNLSDKIKHFQQKAGQLSNPITVESLAFRFKLISDEMKEFIAEADRLVVFLDRQKQFYKELYLHQLKVFYSFFNLLDRTVFLSLKCVIL